jgi:2-keto-3-deoxy-L-rhamnonate aldolase RhmA
MAEPASFAKRLNNRELLIGPIVTLRSPEVSELLAGVGFDWLFIDAEHGPFDPHDALALLQAAGRCPCVIRVPAHDEVWIKKALDIGAAGIIVPQVNTPDQAERIVAAAKYAPIGRRGVGISRAHGFGLHFDRYLRDANQNTCVIIQAEHRDAVDNIDELANVAGVDAILIGPNDLSASYGKPGQLSDPEVQDAIAQIRETCKDAGMPVGFFGGDAAAVLPFIEQGFTLIAVGCDTLFLITAAQRTLAALRGHDPGGD